MAKYSPKKLISMTNLELREGKGRTQILLNGFSTQNGYIIHLKDQNGGHIGVCSIIEPYTNSKGKIGVNISMLSISSHRDYELVEYFKPVVLELNVIICLIIGIHIKDATADEILEIIENTKLIAEKLKKGLKSKI